MAAIDAVNAADPNRFVVDGVERPKEQVHAGVLTKTIAKMSPTALDAIAELTLTAHQQRLLATALAVD